MCRSLTNPSAPSPSQITLRASDPNGDVFTLGVEFMLVNWFGFAAVCKLFGRSVNGKLSPPRGAERRGMSDAALARVAPIVASC
jgi:hypothetical protein